MSDVVIAADVLKALHVTYGQFKEMGLQAFFELATEQGFDLTVSFREPPRRLRGSLSITMQGRG